MVLQEIDRLQSKAMNEMKENSDLTLDQTEAWKTFCKLQKENFPCLCST